MANDPGRLKGCERWGAFARAPELPWWPASAVLGWSSR